MLNLTTCTKDKPWDHKAPPPIHHADAKTTDSNYDYFEEYKCPHCGLVFKVELGDQV